MSIVLYNGEDASYNRDMKTMRVKLSAAMIEALRYYAGPMRPGAPNARTIRALEQRALLVYVGQGSAHSANQLTDAGRAALAEVA